MTPLLIRRGLAHDPWRLVALHQLTVIDVMEASSLLSGEVVAPTSGRDDGAFRPGDEVFGLHGFPVPGHCYAEYVAVPPAELCRNPMTISHVDAAALPMVALTGWQALFALGGLDAGMTQ